MNVSCEGILMRYVLDEKEAFAEIRRYLEVNNIVPEEVTMYEAKIHDGDTNEYIETAKQIVVHSEPNGDFSRSFLIRKKSKPPFAELSQMNDRDYYLREPEELDSIRKEMSEYIATLQHAGLDGGTQCR